MSISPRNLLIFAGAGASKAVNKEQFPTTVAFFDGLPEIIFTDPLFNISLEYIKSIEKVDTVDIEHVLWSLQKLSEFYGSISAPTDIAGFAISTGLTARIFPGANDGNLPSICSQLKSKIDKLISDINAIVYNLYAYEPNEEELENNWISLLNRIRLSDEISDFDIFSTNYDAVIEVLSDLCLENKKFHLSKE